MWRDLDLNQEHEAYETSADAFPRLGCLTGLEPATSGTTSRGSNQLSYRHSGLWRIRTPDFRFRRPALYPAELTTQDHIATAHGTSVSNRCSNVSVWG